MILIVLKIQIRPDRRDVWLERIAKYTAAVREEPGSLSFDVYESVESPNEFSIVEGFASKAAGDAHVQTDHFKDFLVWFPQVIGAAPQIINTEVPDGWSRMSEFS
ncbi:MAG TPA: putative quinol monooxygenase [Acidimicrobiia bacterium]|nr:putative quinol monooxygenase [Acidimicrobiia bacterium]